VLAEILLFALSPRLSISPVVMMAIGSASGGIRWLITAQEPSLALLAAVQLLHSFTYGMTVLGTMALLVRLVPDRSMATAQGYLAALTGFVMSSASVVSGIIYARDAASIYYLAAIMALAGGGVIWQACHTLAIRSAP